MATEGAVLRQKMARHLRKDYRKSAGVLQRKRTMPSKPPRFVRDRRCSADLMNRKKKRHLKTDYSKAAGVVRFGLSEPKAIVHGNECMVLGKDASGEFVCISMEEAIGREWIPTPDEIYSEGGLAEEARRLFEKDEPGTRTGARHGWFGKRITDCVSGIREIAVGQL